MEYVFCNSGKDLVIGEDGGSRGISFDLRLVFCLIFLLLLLWAYFYLTLAHVRNPWRWVWFHSFQIFQNEMQVLFSVCFSPFAMKLVPEPLALQALNACAWIILALSLSLPSRAHGHTRGQHDGTLGEWDVCVSYHPAICALKVTPAPWTYTNIMHVPHKMNGCCDAI